jgi:hypothetical protein
MARHPSMHHTDTLDCLTCVRGQIYLVTDTGEVLMQPGDTVIIRGVNHAWSNLNRTMPARGHHDRRNASRRRLTRCRDCGVGLAVNVSNSASHPWIPYSEVRQNSPDATHPAVGVPCNPGRRYRQRGCDPCLVTERDVP